MENKTHEDIQYYIIPDGGKLIDENLYQFRFSGAVKYGYEWKKIIPKNAFVYTNGTFVRIGS